MRRFINKASKVTVGLLSGAAVAFALAYVSLTVLGYKPVAVVRSRYCGVIFASRMILVHLPRSAIALSSSTP